MLSLRRAGFHSAPIVLAAEILLLPWISLFVPLGLSTLVVVGAIFLLADPKVRTALLCNGLPLYLTPFAIMCLFGLASALWAVDPVHSMNVAWRLSLLLLALLLHLSSVEVLEEPWRGRLLRILASAGLVHLILVGLTIGEQSPLRHLIQIFDPKNLDDNKVHFNRGIAALAVLGGLYLAAWVNWMGWRRAMFMLLLLLGVLSQTLSVSAPVAFGGALLAGLLAWRMKAVGVWLVFGGFLILLGVLPFLLAYIFATEWMQGLMQQTISWNILHRLYIWRFAMERFFEQPFLGWGLDASRQLPGGNQSIPNVPFAEFMPLHPHNGYVQVWLELGPLGAMILGGHLAALSGHLVQIYRKQPLLLGAATATVAAYVLHGLISYGIWQSWWASLALLAATFFKVATAYGSRSEAATGS